MALAQMERASTSAVRERVVLLRIAESLQKLLRKTLKGPVFRRKPPASS
jgi:hypothetical protein